MSPREAVARVPAWAWFLLAALLFVVCLSACGAKTPPELFVSPVPPLPVVEHVTGEHHADDCDVTPLEPDAPPMACAGLVVPEGLVVEWYALPSEVEAWKAAAEHQRASCERDRGYAEAAYGQEWQAGRECRADARAMRWAGMGMGVGGVVLGLIVGYGVGSLP